MIPTYVNDYDGCDCGSITYGWKVQSWSFEENKIVKGIECGGCGKVTPTLN